MTPTPVTRAAELSACGRYRHTLSRVWDAAAPRAAFVMLNPSTADGHRDDPTVRRCVAFARAWGCGGLVVANLFALRATAPRVMLAAADPEGPAADARLLAAVAGCAPVVAAWGAHGGHRGRAAAVRGLLAAAGVPLWCLGRTAAGHPRHPLYLRADAPLTPLPPGE